jgi:uroporphyrinogen-III synthase
VSNFAAATKLDEFPGKVVAACIGPSTAKTFAERYGREPDVVAASHTLDGLIEALEDAWR